MSENNSDSNSGSQLSNKADLNNKQHLFEPEPEELLLSKDANSIDQEQAHLSDSNGLESFEIGLHLIETDQIDRDNCEEQEEGVIVKSITFGPEEL